MKLPTDKAERTKMLVLIAIGVGATIYVLVQYAIMPIMKANKENAERIATVTEILKKAETEVGLIRRDKTANTAAMREIRAASDNNLLHPSMGINYQIPAGEVIASIEERAGLSIGNPPGALAGSIPGPSLPVKCDLKSFGMNVSLNCSYMSLIRIIRAIKAENPCIVISRVSVTGQDKTPEQHAVSFYMSWPVWADPKMVDTIKEWIADEEHTGGDKEP